MPRATAKRSCSPPKDVKVKGHWRELGPRRKKRKPAGPPKTAYYVAESSDGKTCHHHHRTRGGARRCANQHQRKERENRARYLTRKQARNTRMRRWDVTEKKPR
jgi:hypothetical protein